MKKLATIGLFILFSTSCVERTTALKTPFRVADDGKAIVAVPTGKSINYTPKPPLTLTHNSLGKGDLLLSLLCEEVKLTTNNGTTIFAYRPVKKSLYIRFMTINSTMEFTNINTASRDLHIAPGDIVPEYNCHGVTFARYQFIIDNEQIPNLVEADYKECDLSACDAVIYYFQGAVVHSAPRITNDSTVFFIAKGGVRGAKNVESVQAASCGLNYDAVKYIQLKGVK